MRALLRRRRRPINCRQVAAVLQTYLDGELVDAPMNDKVFDHLEECRDCGLEAETYEAIKLSLATNGKASADVLARLEEFVNRLGAGEIDVDTDAQ